ncbi:putative baseplate assembly protein [Methanomethylovorans sp.]|uniref:putative baseplate assembly protein n=1 Tax=Methanomethylovorans sp. TaxID=2758717 RepID=UPI00351C4825
MIAPQISQMDSETTLAEIRKKAPFYVPEWNTGDERDFGVGLSRIFANMSETIMSRLNEAPQKHFLSFLEMLNSSLIPASPARVPLTFMLSEGVSENVLVESSVQASADGPDGKPVIFETETNIIATPSRLVSVYSVIKDSDEIFKHTEAINGTAPAELFTGDKSLQEHVLYIGDENLFNLKDGHIIINFAGSDVNLLRKLGYNDTGKPKGLAEWKYGVKIKEKKDGKEVEAIKWCRFGSVVVNGNQVVIKKDPVLGECKEIESGVVISDKVEVNGVESRWIKCRICENQIGKFKDLSLTGLKVSVSPMQTSINKGGSVKKVQGIGNVFYSKLAGNNVLNKIETLDQLLKLNEEELAFRLQCSRKRAQNILEAARKQFFDKTIETAHIDSKDTFGNTNLQGIAPDLLYYNDTPIPIESPEKALYPFGTKPQIYDTFYIASEDAFSKKGYKVSLNFSLDHGNPSSSDRSAIPILSWEYWDGESWSILEIDESDKKNLSDNTECARRSNSGRGNGSDFSSTVLTISDMPDVKPVRVNGKENYWIRTRLVGGNYGKEYEINDNTVIPGSFCPPRMKDFKIRYEANGKETQPEYIFAVNNLELRNCPDELKTNGIFKPFLALPDTHPAVYFGFDRELKKGPFSLFINIDESIEYPESFMPKVRWQYLGDEDPETWKELEVLDETSGFTKMGMVQFTVPEKMKASKFLGSGDLYWIRAVITGDFYENPVTKIQDQVPLKEFKLYLKKKRPLVYRNLGIKLPDVFQIQPLTTVGKISVIPNLNIATDAIKVDEQSVIKGYNVATVTQISDIGQIKECKMDFELFNIDLMPDNLKKLPPKVLGFYLNSVWAAQSRTIRDEIIGSGNGEADQKFRLINTPVIDETIWVDEVTTLSDKEQKILLEHPSNVSLRKDDKGNILEFWVRWTAVRDLFDSAGEDRHYIIDRNTGEVCFGDGKQGMVPPIGANNIKATYSIGGGRSGNLDALTISKLQSSIAFVDKVFNPISSDGGTETEDIDSLLNRAPVVLKHRNRAMAAEDYEWLAKEASRTVARVKVLPNFSYEGKFSTGWVTVIIVPESPDPQPVPSNELKHRVTEYLTKRCPAVVNLKVIPPSYVKIDVSAELVTDVIDAMPVIEMEAKRRVSEFLHPLTGSAEGKGWNFGFAPCVSDVYSILEQIEYVDHVNNVTMSLHDSSKVMKVDDASAMVKLPEYALPCNGEHQITVDWKNSKQEG